MREILLLAGLASSLLLQGATTKTWEIDEYKDFTAGTFENVSLAQDGQLRLAPRLTSLLSADEPLVWAVAVSPDGSAYVGTGHQGHVYKIDPKGKTKLFWKAPEIEVFALAVGPDGDVYAGTSPKGKVYRLSADGKAEEFFDPQETYIWSLAFVLAKERRDGSEFGGLYIGTGDQGKIYRVDAALRGEVYFETGQQHVVSLALDREGRLLAGTDPNGILYRFESQGKAFVLYDADLPEIRSLQVAPNGDIYAAAMGGGASQATSSFPTAGVATGSAAGTAVTVTAKLGDNPELKGAPPTTATRPAGQPVVTVSRPIISYPGMEKAAVFRIAPDLAIEKLWSSSEESALALELTESAEPELLLATDREGRVYRLQTKRRVSLVAQTDQQQVTQVVSTEQGVLLATAHAGRLFRLEQDPAPAGSYQSSVRNTEKISRWGRLSWTVDTPQGAAIELQTRSGNSARPDATWSNWSDAIRLADPAKREGDALITSPPARYLQWRATLRGEGGVTPVIDRVRATYLPQNSPPLISSIDVSTSASSPGGSTNASSGSTSGRATSSSDTAAFSVTVTDSGEVSSSSQASTEQKTVRGGPREMLTILWQVEDPDGDKLMADVSFRGEGESAWKTIKRDLEESKVTIESDVLADGRYWFRVEVSDRATNPPDTARTADRVSAPVLIDHTPPTVRLLSVEGRASARFEASDEASMVHTAEFSIDAGPWVPVYSDDGIVDSRQESFTLRLRDLGPGEHLVTLRVRDEAGNPGLAKAVIREGTANP